MRFLAVLLVSACPLAACEAQPPQEAAHTAQAPVTGAREAAAKPFTADAIAHFDSPWALAFLPDGRMLVTQKAGRMLLLSADGRRRVTVAGTPRPDSTGQGALGEVVAHPDFARNRLIYFSFSATGKGGTGIVLARGRLAGDTAHGARLEEVREIYRAHPFLSGTHGHYAGRIQFAADGTLFFSTGERQNFTPAQAPKATLGKILRLNDDGTPARGNPLAAKGYDPAIWSYGHRNPLGLALDARQRLWEVEMGPHGGDELNLILPGRNYGWPIVSNGDKYDGTPIPGHATRPDLEAPKASWNPSISPAGLLLYSGDLFPAWKGHALIACLSGEMVVDVALDGDSAREVARYPMGRRIRAVDQGPDGAVYLLEDGPGGRLLRLAPKG